MACIVGKGTGRLHSGCPSSPPPRAAAFRLAALPLPRWGPWAGPPCCCCAATHCWWASRETLGSGICTAPCCSPAALPVDGCCCCCACGCCRCMPGRGPAGAAAAAPASAAGCACRSCLQLGKRGAVDRGSMRHQAQAAPRAAPGLACQPACQPTQSQPPLTSAAAVPAAALPAPSPGASAGLHGRQHP